MIGGRLDWLVATAYAAVLVVALATRAMPFPILLLSAALGAALVWLSIVDVRTYRLPNPLTMGLTGAGLLAAYVLDPSDVVPHVLAAAGSFAFLTGANFLYLTLRGQDGIGGGDAKLLAAAGAWTGPEGALSILLMATLLALAAVAASAVLGQRPDRQTRLPFGPFLGLALWITWLFGPLQ